MSEFILKMDKWDRVENSYIYPRTPNKSSWRRTGLVPENDYQRRGNYRLLYMESDNIRRWHCKTCRTVKSI